MDLVPREPLKPGPLSVREPCPGAQESRPMAFNNPGGRDLLLLGAGCLRKRSQNQTVFRTVAGISGVWPQSCFVQCDTQTEAVQETHQRPHLHILCDAELLRAGPQKPGHRQQPYPHSTSRLQQSEDSTGEVEHPPS